MSSVPYSSAKSVLAPPGYDAKLVNKHEKHIKGSTTGSYTEILQLELFGHASAEVLLSEGHQFFSQFLVREVCSHGFATMVVGWI